MTTELTVDDLFTPTPSGVGPNGNVPLVPGSSTWLGKMLTAATIVQLPTTSWQSGAPERTIFAAMSVMFAESDVNVSIVAQGGFLQSAASGTVTYTRTDGTVITVPVTPDPSNAAQNPTGAPGWLDLLTQNVYDVTRIAASFASGALAFANLKGSTVGPYAAGAYHASNTITGATYHNANSLTIPSSALAGSAGTVTSCTTGLTTTSLGTASAHGLTVGQVVYLVMLGTGVTFANGATSGFGTVSSTPTTTSLVVSVPSTGTYTSGGTMYLCTVATMTADVAGIGGNAAPGAVTTAITQNANVFVSNVLPWNGSNWESNTALADRAVLSLAARSPNGPSQAYVYFAETAAQLLPEQTPSYTLTNGPVVAEAFSNPSTGIITTVVASATPVSSSPGANVTPGCSQNPVTAVTNANPAVVTCSSATGMSPGTPMTMTITGVLGAAGAGVTVNGTFVATYVSANSFSIPVDTSTASAYSGGGQVEGGDLGQIDQLIQQNVVPDDNTAFTISALALPITVTATVVVPQAYVATYQANVVTQLQAQIASYPIGGDANSVPANSVSWDDLFGALTDAGVFTLGAVSVVKAVQSLSVNGNTTSGSGVAFPSPFYQAILLTPAVTVIGV